MYMPSVYLVFLFWDKMRGCVRVDALPQSHTGCDKKNSMAHVLDSLISLCVKTADNVSGMLCLEYSYATATQM